MECRACGHKHNVWDADELVRTHKDTKEFVQIKGSFHIKDDEWYGDKEVRLYACPSCKTVIMGGE